MQLRHSVRHFAPVDAGDVAPYCRLQQALGAVAAALAPHLRLAQSEKALQATQQLLREAVALEQAQAAAWQLGQQRQQQQQGQAPAAAAQQPAAPATPKGPSALRKQSTSSTTMDSIDQPQLAAAAAAIAAASAPAADAPEQPLAERLLTAPRTAAHHAVQWLQLAAGASFRPARESARAPLQRDLGVKKAGKAKGKGKGKESGYAGELLSAW